MTTNVVSIHSKRAVPVRKDVPLAITGPIQAITDWAESNGIDVHNDMRFIYRLADFMALLQQAAAENARKTA